MPAAALRMTARSVTMTFNWNVPPGEARPITEALHVLMIAARAERGYVNCSLSAELGDFAKVRYREEWQTEEDLQRQVQEPALRQAGRAHRASQRPAERAVPPGELGSRFGLR